MLLDLAGQLNSINLAESKALWPLFEAIVNSTAHGNPQRAM